jgi:DNA segregation ATPase FtsK/SpoIIIE-like protein
MVILDELGAEKLQLFGDMLFKFNGKTTRLQSAYITPKEVKDIKQEHIEKFGSKTFAEEGRAEEQEEKIEEVLETILPKALFHEGDLSSNGQIILDDQLYLLALKGLEGHKLSMKIAKAFLSCGDRLAIEHLNKLQKYGFITEYKPERKGHLYRLKEETIKQKFIPLSEVVE